MRRCSSPEIDIARIFTNLGAWYGWATPHFLLDCMSLSLVLIYFDYGLEAHSENHKAGGNSTQGQIKEFKNRYKK